MARQPIISRTIKSYTSKCIVFVDADNTTVEREITTTSDTDKARQASLPDGERLIKTLETTTTEQIWGMTIPEFMSHAKPITRTKSDN